MEGLLYLLIASSPVPVELDEMSESLKGVSAMISTHSTVPYSTKR